MEAMEKWIAQSVNIGSTVFCGRIRGHSVFTDAPEDVGGYDLAPMPPEVILPALANCMGTVIALACEARGVPYQGMRRQVEAEVIEGENRLDNFRLEIQMPEDLAESGRRVIQAAEDLCKVAGTLRHGAHVEIVETFGDRA